MPTTPEDAPWMDDDIVVACANLVGRCGAGSFELGHTRAGVPVEEAGWYAHAAYRGGRIMVQDHRSPTGAALALAERMLAGASCKCGRPVSMSDRAAGCRWRLQGRRWEAGCSAPAIRVHGQPGDFAAMRRAMGEQLAARHRVGGSGDTPPNA